MPASTPARRRLLLGAVVALALGSAGLTPTSAGAEPPPPGTVDLGGDMAPIEVDEVGPGVLPPALAGDDTAVAAASVEPIQPGQGFTPWQVGVPNFGGYRFQLVEGTPETVRSWVQSVANQLSAMTSVQFTVDPGTVPRPASYPSNLFATGPSDSATWGVIRVLMFDNLSPCGPLAPVIPMGVVGCGGPDDVAFRGARTHVRGSIWLASSLQIGTAALQAETTAHEAGHAIGLAHHDSTFQGVSQLMNSTVSGTPPPGRCGTHYRSGDRNGVWYEQNRTAWLISAQYRDFLGRIPDFGGYDFWLRSGVDANGLATSLSSSPEWVGKVVDELYLGFRGGPPESTAARDFWSARIREFGVPAIAAEMYASDEYFANHGGNLDDWIRGLYHDLLGAGRVPNSDDLAFWRATAVRSGRSAVALSIYQSLENRRARVDRLYLQLLDRVADEPGRVFWAEQILRFGDLALATFLASSTEYQQNADEFALAPPACTS